MICKNCNQYFKAWAKINGRQVSLSSRRYCLDCVPFGSTGKTLMNSQRTEKHCKRCNTTKPVEQFYARKRSQNDTSPYCISCMLDQSNERQRALKIQAVEYLGGQCVVCRVKDHPSVYDFHHLNPAEKEFTIATRKTVKLDKIKSELDKCVLICACCHRKLHANALEQNELDRLKGLEPSFSSITLSSLEDSRDTSGNLARQTGFEPA